MKSYIFQHITTNEKFFTLAISESKSFEILTKYYNGLNYYLKD